MKRSRIIVLVYVFLLMSSVSVVRADGPDAGGTPSWSRRTSLVLGTVIAREEVIAPPAPRHWRVTVKVDRVLFGKVTTPTLTFAMDVPMWQPPKEGRRYRIATTGPGPDDVAETAPLLDEAPGARSRPFAGAIGNAMPLPDDDRSASAIMVAFGTKNAVPARDAILTLVAADPSLRATTTRFACAERDEHDDSTAVHLDPVTTPEWLGRQRAAVDAGRTYPRVMVLPGDFPGARALDPATIAPGDLPRRARPQSVIAAVDSNGDGRPDLVALRSCRRSTGCDNESCEDVWTLLAGKWSRRDRTCGD